VVYVKYVIALGGNALDERMEIDDVAATIAGLYDKGNYIVVTHGNGPQVGSLSSVERLSLPILTAQTEAWIGIEIGNRISRALNRIRRSYGYSVPTVVLTNVIVADDREAFRNPTKPIGRFLSRNEAASARKDGFVVKKLMHGYRRVVPSPSPSSIVQKELVKSLLRERHIVIACGGGGIPMKSVSGRLDYVSAVIDKDRSSALLAKEIGADRFLILTNVEGAYLDFGTKKQRLLGRTSAGEMEQYLRRGCFEEGSMRPKVESCVYFAKATGKCAGIGSMSDPGSAISLKRLTLVTP
jgi:carbamate kinase